MRDQTISEYLSQLADRVPAPGGGAAAALHAAQGAALLGMVARYTTGEKYAEHRDAVERIIARTDTVRSAALRVGEEDAAAFTAVIDAYRLHKGERAEAVAHALAGAARPPAEVVGLARAVVELATELLPIGNRNVVTDIAAATEAARAAATTARINVEINLGGIKDEALRAELTAVVAAVDDIADRAARLTDAVRLEIAP
ncbi:MULTISPECIES: cyclodeaminase/cyclohydrolase family protein [unclassified Streptomyces]|uniref:cyclodeaminase/cyclohydrolase family protein n=1 Tax=unclassified Streptomyces TaxID=2593676 RepID=UPI0019089749|nr:MULTISPECIES: cyclodeaminase/cyclohydrolase family protein [unclassified Streptomyces]MCU4748485.1 cyclodeaminase/cyclohydrolase family protein [Streptomyces sp. G-5]QQN79026.1 cyclodeaminase/cyclohydrolase family protein [Streptomyces sp. XC 2026]